MFIWLIFFKRLKSDSILTYFIHFLILIYFFIKQNIISTTNHSWDLLSSPQHILKTHKSNTYT